jgi:3-hydroxyisobutyrate dehydrogenase-like beta-hydroxyacid dehydrogenase
MKIAFLGLGRMGSGMASRLASNCGHALAVWNRSPEKAKPISDLGASVAADPADAISGADLVITSFLDDKSVEALFHEGAPALAAMKPNAIHLCVTTISPALGNRLQALHGAHGGRYVSGPVVGRPDAAARGELVQFISGDASAFAEVESACRAFTTRIVPLPGPAGAANSQKLCINFFLAAQLEAMSECYTLAESLGASREALAAFFQLAFAAPGLKGYADRMSRREDDSAIGFAMATGLKDVHLIREAAASVKCPVDIADVIASKLEDGVSMGLANRDWSAVQEIARERAGLSAKLGAA